MALVSALAEGLHGVGDLKPCGGDVGSLVGTQEPEKGWLLCNGAVVAQSLYARLFSKIGSSYNTGGEGTGNFRLPDFRDRHPLPTGNLSTRPVGLSFGSIAHKHSAAHVHTMSHTHDLSGHIHDLAGHGHNVGFGGPSAEVGVNDTPGGAHTGTSYTGHVHATSSSAGPSPANTGGPSATTGDASPTNTGADLRSSDLAAAALTDGKDAPYLVVGALLVHY